MFTGIIEEVGVVQKLWREQSNLHITIQSNISKDLKIDQSVSHNGICLTVVAKDDASHTVTAIQETLDKTNLGQLNQGDHVNLERAMKLGARLDGHIVQGHVDTVATCTEAMATNGSWLFTFEYRAQKDHITIEKGSITVNGVSLTVVNSKDDSFSVAIIPYTYEHTQFKDLSVGDSVNLEFDVIGKYVAKLHQVAT